MLLRRMSTIFQMCFSEEKSRAEFTQDCSTKSHFRLRFVITRRHGSKQGDKASHRTVTSVSKIRSNSASQRAFRWVPGSPCRTGSDRQGKALQRLGAGANTLRKRTAVDGDKAGGELRVENIGSQIWKSGPARREIRAERGIAVASSVIWGSLNTGTWDSDAERCCMYCAPCVLAAAKMHKGIGLRWSLCVGAVGVPDTVA